MRTTTKKKRNSIVYPSSITMVVVGRNNLTVFEPTSIGSVLVKEGRSPTTSRLARLALVFRHSCDDISTPRLPNSTFYFDEGHKFLM